MSEAPKKSVRELIEDRDALVALREAIAERIENISKEEQMEVDALVKKSFDPQCTFDRKNRHNLYHLALAPEQVVGTSNCENGSIVSFTTDRPEQKSEASNETLLPSMVLDNRCFALHSACPIGVQR